MGTPEGRSARKSRPATLPACGFEVGAFYLRNGSRSSAKRRRRGEPKQNENNAIDGTICSHYVSPIRTRAAPRFGLPGRIQALAGRHIAYRRQYSDVTGRLGTGAPLLLSGAGGLLGWLLSGSSPLALTLCTRLTIAAESADGPGSRHHHPRRVDRGNPSIAGSPSASIAIPAPAISAGISHGCVRYRESLDRQLPNAPRIDREFAVMDAAGQ